MRLAGAWTACMAIAIAILSASLVVRAGGGSASSWVLAAPGAFIGLQLLGLPIVFVGEFLERLGLVTAGWRPQLHECGMVAVLLGIAWRLIGVPVALAVIGFFALMYTFRILFRANWNPGQPEELER